MKETIQLEKIKYNYEIEKVLSAIYKKLQKSFEDRTQEEKLYIDYIIKKHLKDFNYYTVTYKFWNDIIMPVLKNRILKNKLLGKTFFCDYYDFVDRIDKNKKFKKHIYDTFVKYFDDLANEEVKEVEYYQNTINEKIKKIKSIKQIEIETRLLTGLGALIMIIGFIAFIPYLLLVSNN